MQAVIEFFTRILFIFTLALTMGTLVLLGFVRVCIKFGFMVNKPGSTNGFSEFLKNFT